MSSQESRNEEAMSQESRDGAAIKQRTPAAGSAEAGGEPRSHETSGSSHICSEYEKQVALIQVAHLASCQSCSAKRAATELDGEASTGVRMDELQTTSVVQHDEDKVDDHAALGEDSSVLDSLQHSDRAETLEAIDARLNRWQKAFLDIGVIGRSGSGKSSFINAVRSIPPRAPGAAPVGVAETTIKPTDYSHPRNANIKFWDLPGVGTRQFPRKDYLERVNFKAYDFFIIISSTRFTEDDIWLATEIRRSGRNFYFVRTKIDDDIANDIEDYGRENHDEEKLLSDIRNHCETNLCCSDLPNVPVFLVSSKFRLKFDFEKLEAEYMKHLPELKKEAALYSMVCVSSTVIEDKAKVLLQRVKDAAFKCSIATIVPIPGLSYLVDMSVLSSEITLYKGVFGLDCSALDQLSESSGVPREKFLLRLERHEWNRCSSEDVHCLLKAHAPEYFMKNVISSVPVLGTIVGPRLAYKVATNVLVNVIESMRKEALELRALAAGRT